MPLRCTQVYGAEWGLPKGSEDTGGSSQRATFHHLLAVLTGLAVSKYDPFTIHNKGQKKNPGNHRPVSLTLGIVLEQVILSAILWQNTCKITQGSDPASVGL